MSILWSPRLVAPSPLPILAQLVALALVGLAARAAGAGGGGVHCCEGADSMTIRDSCGSLAVFLVWLFVCLGACWLVAVVGEMVR